ncbi:MAG: mannose-1-phosphate guanylyltransferase [Hyphomicrobiales bacterium]
MEGTGGIMVGTRTDQIVPVILAGGSGSRLWPLSTASAPKQFQHLTGPDSLFRQTVGRCAGVSGFAAPLIVAGLPHESSILADLAGIEATIVLEPVARNTAVAMTLAALAAADMAGNPCLLVMPSDHHLGQPRVLIEAVRQAMACARAGKFVTFGIAPDRPETGFGYIRPGREIALNAPAKAHEIAQFIEKPGAARAEALLQEGRCLWNSGNFLFARDTLLAAMAALNPQILRACRAAMAAATARGSAIVPAAAPLQGIESISFDHAVMEKTGDAVVVAIDPDWSDIGSWDAVWRAAGKDACGNVVSGNSILKGVSNSYVSSSGAVTVVIGLDGVAVVNTGEAVLVTTLDRAQDVRAVIDLLRERK